MRFTATYTHVIDFSPTNRLGIGIFIHLLCRHRQLGFIYKYKTILKLICSFSCDVSRTHHVFIFLLWHTTSGTFRFAFNGEIFVIVRGKSLPKVHKNVLYCFYGEQKNLAILLGRESFSNCLFLAKIFISIQFT